MQRHLQRINLRRHQRLALLPPAPQAASTERPRRPRAAALLGLLLALVPPLVPQQLARSASLFEARPVDPERFIVLGRPLRQGDWSLVVLEQIESTGPACWRVRADGLVETAANRGDLTGLCGRYVDSNGFSLRLSAADSRRIPESSFHLRLQPMAGELQLQAASPDRNQVLVVARAVVPRVDRQAFVALRLEPGWELQRRVYGGQNLNHLYVSNSVSLEVLQARALRARPGLVDSPAAARGGSSRTQLRLSQLPPPPPLPPELPGLPQAGASSGRAIALQVIPFRESGQP